MSLQHHRTDDDTYSDGTARLGDTTGPVGGFEEVKSDLEDLSNLVDPYGWHPMTDDAVGVVQSYIEEYRPDPEGENISFFRTLGAAVSAATYEGMSGTAIHATERPATEPVPEHAKELLEPAIKAAYGTDTEEVRRYLASARGGAEDWEAISKQHESRHRGRL